MLALALSRSASIYLCLTHFECLDFYGLCHFCLLCAGVCAAPLRSLSQCLCKSSLRLRRPAPVYILPLPSALARLVSLTLTLWHILFWNYIFGHFVETVSCSALGLALAAAPGHPACDSSCSLPPHHFLLTKNSLLGNFSLFILFATLQKCLCPGQSMPQMHSIVPAPLWPRPLPVAVANRLPLTVRIPCVFIELRNVFYALWKH